MGKILMANNVRLFKNAPFYVCIIMQIFFTLLDVLPYDGFLIENILCQNPASSTLLTAFFVPLFIGREYGYKTIRNKIISGHSRFEIYCENYVSVAIGVLIISITPLIAGIILAAPFGGRIGCTPAVFALYVISVLAVNAAMCGIYVVSAMLVTSRANNVVLSVCVWFASFFIASLIADMPLAESGARAFFEWLYDVMPMGQIVRLMDGETRGLGMFPIWSVGVIALSVAVGMLFFRRKDLK